MLSAAGLDRITIGQFDRLIRGIDLPRLLIRISRRLLIAILGATLLSLIYKVNSTLFAENLFRSRLTRQEFIDLVFYSIIFIILYYMLVQACLAEATNRSSYKQTLRRCQLSYPDFILALMQLIKVCLYRREVSNTQAKKYRYSIIEDSLRGVYYKISN